MAQDVGKTILIVEDDPIIALMERKQLENEKYRVLHTASGEKAVELVCVAREPVDLVLMDIDLGTGMDGTEAARHILATVNIPLIFLSSHTEKEIVEKTESITNYGYVVKNSSFTVLDASIKMAFRLFDASKVIIRQRMEMEASYEEMQTANESLIRSQEALLVTESELRKSEERFKALHNASFGGIAIHDKGIILDCNKGLSDMTGYSEAELHSGMDGLSLIAEKSRDIVRDRIRSGYEKPYEVMGVRKDGSEYPLRLEARNIPYKGSQVRVVEFRDITEQKRMEKELRESEERFRSYIDNAPDGIFLADERSHYTEVNPAACEMTGYTEDELCSMHIMDLIPPAEAEKAIAHFDRVRKDGTSTGESAFVTKAGEVRHWSISAVKLSDTRYMGFTKDITDRIRAEQTLRGKEEQYRFALEGSNLGEWDWDYASGKVVRNARWAEMLGYTPEEVDGTLQSGVDLRHPDDVDTIEKQVSDHFSGITDHYSIEYRMRTKDGGYKWIRDCGKIMLRDKDGNPVRICGTHEDIDESRRARNRIDSLLAEKELLLREVHHRIKNNMNTMRSLLSLQGSMVSEPSARNALLDAESRLKSMSILYDKLYQSADYKNLSLRQYVSTLAHEVIASFQNGSTIQILENVEEIVMDAGLLQTIGIMINEILTNAMKYAFAGRESGSISITAARHGNLVSLSLQDDGVGMPASIDFEHTTGFGLQLIRGLAGQLEGSARIERGAGTTMVVEFPLRNADDAAAAGIGTSGSTPETRSAPGTTPLQGKDAD